MIKTLKWKCLLRLLVMTYVFYMGEYVPSDLFLFVVWIVFSCPVLSNSPFESEIEMYFKLLLPWLNCLCRSIASVIPRSDYLLSNTCYNPAHTLFLPALWSAYPRASLSSNSRNFFFCKIIVRLVSHFACYGGFLPFLQQRQTNFPCL